MAHFHSISTSISHFQEQLQYSKRLLTNSGNPADRFQKNYDTYSDPVYFYGTFQPLSQEEIELKPENQWQFRWYVIKTLDTSINLALKDRIIYNGENFVVKGKKFWNNFGFISFEVSSDLNV